MIALVMPYYMNGEMLRLQYRNFTSWPSRARNAIKIIIVDDGSPSDPAASVPRPYGLPELEIYRVIDDRPWHQHGARNLGAFEADREWLLLTDMDHMLEPEGAMALTRLAENGRLDAEAGADMLSGGGNKIASEIGSLNTFTNYNGTIRGVRDGNNYRITHWNTVILDYNTDTNEIISLQDSYISQTTSTLVGRILRSLPPLSVERYLGYISPSKDKRRLIGMLHY